MNDVIFKKVTELSQAYGLTLVKEVLKSPLHREVWIESDQRGVRFSVGFRGKGYSFDPYFLIQKAYRLRLDEKYSMYIPVIDPSEVDVLINDALMDQVDLLEDEDPERDISFSLGKFTLFSIERGFPIHNLYDFLKMQGYNQGVLVSKELLLKKAATHLSKVAVNWFELSQYEEALHPRYRELFSRLVRRYVWSML